MEIEIIPVINVDSFEEVQQKIKTVEPFSPPAGGWVHIDVADGTFTKNTLWHNPRDLMLLDTSLYIEVHLMLNDIDSKIGDWLACPERSRGVNRIIFHLSASADPDFVISEIKKAGKEVGISISPDESVAEAMKYKKEACPERSRRVNFFQILGVEPGLAGQKTLESTFDRIKEVRDSCPLCIIEVDGGMNKETAKRAVEAGADIIVAASYIFNSDNIEKAIVNLKNQ